MEPIILRPDARLRTKFYLMLAAGGVIMIAGLMLFIWGIAADEGADNALSLAAILTFVINALWIVPLWLVVGPYTRSLQYEIADDEVLVRVGVITKTVKHVPYRTVTNLKVMRGPLDRVFGLGTLNIQTAGMSGQQGAEESLIGLTDYQQTYDRVAAMLRRYRGAMAPDQAGTEAGPVSADGEVLTAMLEELRAIRKGLAPQE